MASQSAYNGPGVDELARYRESIDRLDAALVQILAERFRVTEHIGHLKRARGMPSLDAQREEAQEKRLRTLANEAGLNADVMAQVFETITACSRARHEEILRE